jgi:anthranilate synthase component I
VRGSAYDTAVATIDGAVASLARPHVLAPVAPPSGVLTELPEIRRRTPYEEYARAVEAAKEYILSGDIFQVVLAQRFDLEEPLDPMGLYRVLRLVNPSPYMYFVRFGTSGDPAGANSSSGEPIAIVGSSPEMLVQLRDGTVIERPIAGTRKRGRDPEHDRRLEAELVEHPKERAEHVMLVDLARNDLGRVVQYGTEHVDELMTLERYSHVMHLTSQVVGTLRDGLGPIDVIRATFPAGTVSGAPKVRAMEIIDELESSRRGPYAGVVGYFDFSGNLDVAISIRTMLFQGTRASISAGAGIVADSVPEDEDLECRNKAAALLTAARCAQDLFPVGEAVS